MFESFEHFSNKMLVVWLTINASLFSIICAEIHKTLVRIANWEDPDQTASSASSEAVWSESVLFV